MESILHGILLAFGLILPLGVQNVFVFSQGATQISILKALPATITAALCDTLLISLAVFGLSAIVFQLEFLKIGLMLIGVIFLVYMGYSIWKSKPATIETGNPIPTTKQIVFALSVSLLNPHAILDTVGVIGTSALKYEGTDKYLFTFACIAVSWCWFVGLTVAGSIMKRLDESGKMMVVFNKSSAIFIWCTAIYLIIGLI